MKQIAMTFLAWIAFDAAALAGFVEWRGLNRSIAVQGSYAVTDDDRCSVEEIDEVPQLICAHDDVRINQSSAGLEPLAGVIEFGDFGSHHASQTIAIDPNMLSWTSDASAASQSGSPGHHWFTAGGQGTSQLSLAGELLRPAAVHLSATLAIEGDSYDDDGATIRLSHFDKMFNERIYEWRVSCNSVCSSMPLAALSIDETHLLPPGQIYLEADVTAGGGYVWDLPIVHADFSLSFAPVPEPSAIVILGTTAVVLFGSRKILRRRPWASS